MKRSILALFSGVLISLALFWLMQAMISNKQPPLKKNKVMQMTDFIKLKKTQTETSSKHKLEPEEPPPLPPPPPEQQSIEQKSLPEMQIPLMDIPQPDILNSADVQLAVVKKKPNPKPIDKPKKITTPVKTTVRSPVTTTKPTKVVVKKSVKATQPKMSNKVNSNVRATYKAAPKYPKRAANRRQQGWVKVQFIITANGSVKNPFIVASKPSDVFDKAALKAIRRWKFKPKVVNGQKVSQRAVQTIKFRLR